MHCSSCQYTFLLTLAAIPPLVACYIPSTSHGSKHSHPCTSSTTREMRFPGPTTEKGEGAPSLLSCRNYLSYSQRNQGHTCKSTPRDAEQPTCATKWLMTKDRTENPRAPSTIICCFWHAHGSVESTALQTPKPPVQSHCGPRYNTKPTCQFSIIKCVK